MAGLLRWVMMVSLGCLAVSATAHDSRPLYIELREIQAGLFQLRWKAPPSLPSPHMPDIDMPAPCLRQGDMAEMVSPVGTSARATYRCDEDISGHSLSIRYPEANPSLSTLVRYHGISGQQHTAVLGPQDRDWILPDAETPSRVAGFYTLMGVEHIWMGIDHLLFLVCLLWIAGTWKRILVTVTGFTLAHSMTLALSALDVVTLPIAPVEAVIALSILFLAREIVRGRDNSLTWRYPIAVSSSFGLLHGFGFANALYEVGLPQTEIPLALLFFNVGVEIGQVLFVLCVIGIGRLGAWIARTSSLDVSLRQGEIARLLVLYGVGILSSFWFFERIRSFV